MWEATRSVEQRRWAGSQVRNLFSDVFHAVSRRSRLLSKLFATPATTGFSLNRKLWVPHFVIQRASLWYKEQQQLPAAGKARRQSRFWPRCKSGFIFGTFHKNHLVMWHLFLSDLEENGGYEKLLFNLHLICVYWHIYCDSKQTLLSSSLAARGWGSFCLLDSLSPTRAFCYNSIFFPKKKSKLKWAPSQHRQSTRPLGLGSTDSALSETNKSRFHREDSWYVWIWDVTWSDLAQRLKRLLRCAYQNIPQRDWHN